MIIDYGTKERRRFVRQFPRREVNQARVLALIAFLLPVLWLLIERAAA